MTKRVTCLIFFILITTANFAITDPIVSEKSNYYEYNQTRADSAHGFDVTKYTIDIAIDDESEYISGSVISEVTATENISEISYELEALDVTQIKLNGETASYSYENGLITIDLGSISSGENFTTKVYYEGNPELGQNYYTLGMFFNSNLVYTISDPNAARYWWPCYDHPWDKAIIDISVTVRDDWRAACNGIREEVVNNNDGTNTHIWKGENPMATYLVSICASNYEELTDNFESVPIQNFVPNGTSEEGEEIFENLPYMMEVFSDIYGYYPFEKYGNAIASISTFGAMEHQTMTTLGSNYYSTSQNAQVIIAHELSHQWFGNSLTPLTWKDVWLSEGFATYSEFIYLVKWKGWDEARDYMESSIHNYYKNWMNSQGPHSCYDPILQNTFSPVTYEKPASVLHMLRLKLGEDVFWEVIQTYYETYENSNVVTDDFQNICEEISGTDLDYFFEQWIYGTGLPSVDLTFFFSEESNQIKTYAQTFSETSTSFKLDLPLLINTENGDDSLLVAAEPEIIEQISEFSGNFNNLEFDPHNWLLIDTYNVNLPSFDNYYVGDGKVFLQWNDFSEITEIEGYKIYRSENPDSDYQLLNETIIQDNNYIDETVNNNTVYYYKVAAVENGEFKTPLSEYIEAAPIEFSLDQGVLIVDETNDGQGTPQNPSDEMVDDFYREGVVVNDYVTEYDVIENGLPSLEYLSNFSTVIWHDDDFSNNQIMNIEFDLSCYILGGGNLHLSGWKTANNLSDNFLNYFLNESEVNLIQAPLMYSAESEIEYQTDLYVNPDKVIAPWNGYLGLVCSFSDSDNSIFSYNSEEGSDYDGRSCGISCEPEGKLVLLGFPLYFFRTSEVYTYLHEVLADFGEPVGTENNEIPMAFEVSAYPNPAQNEVNIELANMKRSEKIKEIVVFNILGQKVKSINAEDLRDNKIKWNFRNDSGHQVSNGIYFFRVQTSDHLRTKKVILLK